MTDVFSVEKRHDIMSKIKGKDTKIEIKVRKWLYKNG
jgi:DNA mismatch endonuclease (patch repair protein)